MSKLGDIGQRHDHFYRRAQRQQFAARSVFKLEEIDRRVGLFRPGDRVLDLGCRPGSWLQYAAQRVGQAGRLVGLDRQALAIQLPMQARVVVGDVFEVEPALLRGDLEGFDVVLSDMAPDTSGIRSLDQDRSLALCERALELALELLVKGGHFASKVFQGPSLPVLRERARVEFSQVRLLKPESSRKHSPEMYLVALTRAGVQQSTASAQPRSV